MSLAIFPKAFSVGFIPRIDGAASGLPAAPGDSNSKSPDIPGKELAFKLAPDSAGTSNKDTVDLSMKPLNRETRFEMDYETKKVVVKVIDKNTNEEVKQIPDKRALQLSKSIGDYQQKTFENRA